MRFQRQDFKANLKPPSLPRLANQAALDNVESADLAQSTLERSQEVFADIGAQGLFTGATWVARVQTSFAQARATFGRLLVPWSRRPLAPPQDNLQSFVLIWAIIWPLSKAL